MFDRFLFFCSGAVIGMCVGFVTMDIDHFLYPYAHETCDSITHEQEAVEACLLLQPACEAVTIEHYRRYYENKDWLAEHCQAEPAAGSSGNYREKS